MEEVVGWFRVGGQEERISTRQETKITKNTKIEIEKSQNIYNIFVNILHSYATICILWKDALKSKIYLILCEILLILEENVSKIIRDDVFLDWNNCFFFL